MIQNWLMNSILQWTKQIPCSAFLLDSALRVFMCTPSSTWTVPERAFLLGADLSYSPGVNMDTAFGT